MLLNKLKLGLSNGSQFLHDVYVALAKSAETTSSDFIASQAEQD